MSTTTETKNMKPHSKEDVQAIVEWAVAQEQPLEIIGQGSKQTLGHAVAPSEKLDMSALTGVTLFEPEELVLTAKAGTPLKEITDLLDENNQELQFEPMDMGPVFGQAAGQGTLGGLISTNFAGPRRLKAGSARDHILGVEAVSGRGEAFKSGGRVVKNVTGYDLSKGMTGAYGTLAVLTDITVKVMPKAETEQTLMLTGLTDAQAVIAMAEAMGSNAEVSAAAHLPQGVATGSAATLLRVEGFAPSVEARMENLTHLLSAHGDIQHLDEATSRAQWWAIRDCTPFAVNIDRPLWRISCIPSESHHIVSAIRNAAPAQAIYDWQGGLIWLEMEDEDPGASLVRTTISNCGGGHATLVRASAEMRQTTDVFHPQPAPLAALSQRYRKQFDPAGILNPGRMERQG